MSQHDILKPIGLNKANDLVDSICRDAKAYRHGAKLKHLIIPLDPGSGRTTYIEYLTGMFKEHGVLEFICSTDDYIEVTIDASSPRRIAETFSMVKETADYDNDYCNVVAMDISDVASYIGQTQYKDFLEYIKNLSKTAFLVLFVNSEPSRNEDTVIKGIIETAGEDLFVRLPYEPYTNEEICLVIQRIIMENGIDITDKKKFNNSLSDLLSEFNITHVKDAVKIADALLHLADYSEDPVIDYESLLYLKSNRDNTNERSGNK